jgi:hypothetical protein
MNLFAKARLRFSERQQARREEVEKRQAFAFALGNFAWREATDDSIAALLELRSRADFDAKDLMALQTGAVARMVNDAISDDVLDSHEEDRVMTVVKGLGLTQRVIEQDPGLWTHLIVARINDGRLPELAPEMVNIRLKPGEMAHASVSAALLKEVAVKEWRGRSQGVSFRVTKGVRYRVGASRGRLVTVGSQVVTDDVGPLYVTSTRCVFTGRRRALEFDYKKLLDVHLYTDGLGLAVSNRQATSTFRISGASGEVIAAIINGAAQKLA